MAIGATETPNFVILLTSMVSLFTWITASRSLNWFRPDQHRDVLVDLLKAQLARNTTDPRTHLSLASEQFSRPLLSAGDHEVLGMLVQSWRTTKSSQAGRVHDCSGASFQILSWRRQTSFSIILCAHRHEGRHAGLDQEPTFPCSLDSATSCLSPFAAAALLMGSGARAPKGGLAADVFDFPLA